MAPDALNHCILCGLIIGHSPYSGKYLPCISTVLGAEVRAVNKTDKVPVPPGPIFPCELILSTHEFMSEPQQEDWKTVTAASPFFCHSCLTATPDRRWGSDDQC